MHRQHEGYWGHVNPIGPRACYDEGKRSAESMCRRPAAPPPRHRLGWQPSVPLREGLPATIDYFRNLPAEALAQAARIAGDD